MKIDADFSTISSNTDRLEPGTYRFVVKSAAPEEPDSSKPHDPTKQIPFTIVSEVVNGPRAGYEMSDRIYLKKKDGGPNKMGLGRVKAYAEATLGEAAANDKNFDTDQLIGNAFDGNVVHEPYTDSSTTPPTQKFAVKIGKILPAS
jgi:hypothetical protein